MRIARIPLVLLLLLLGSSSMALDDEKPVKPEDVIVYVTKTGKKYHVESCHFLSKSMIPIKLKTAVSLYTPCSICKPPTLDEKKKP